VVVGWDRIDNLGQVKGTDWLIELEKRAWINRSKERSFSPVNSKLLNCSVRVDYY